MKALALIFALTFTAKTFAYSENITHGYLNCMACHLSPAGGDVLNDYGRTLSKELMSTWGIKGSEQPLFGVLKNTEKVKWGGDFRSIQTHYKSDRLKRGSGFIMQKNIEAGLKFMKVWFVGSIGTQEGPKNFPNKGEILSEKHYLIWESGDNQRVRIGKFKHHFGLNDPIHTRSTKSSLGFGSNSEHYNIEYSFFTDINEIFITTDFGKMDASRKRQNEKSFSLNYAHYAGDKSKIGASFLYGEENTNRRNIFSQYGLLSLPLHHYLKYEIDFQQAFSLTSDRVDLVVSNVTLGNQMIKGLTPYLISEFTQRNLKIHNTRTESFGLGTQWLPFPHFEFQLEYQRIKSRSSGISYSDSGWLLFHFYL